ncbi:phage/plasmid primase, P4 family [Mesorhizobium erdmanii]|uniref:phage/plasmid primase, P4 family n=1 Tax=Mesorhizobium erdmanii TaxID=1777866 RepID=UPI00040BE8B5|nr:phage/plasmid primase, P4 family [Mesorhizobium erdmanii]
MDAFPNKRRRKPTDDAVTVTEDGAALGFATHFSEELRYDHDARMWFEWTGSRWQPDKTKIAFHLIREFARELAASTTGKETAAVRKTSFVAGVERFAQADPHFAVTSDIWNADPFLLGTPGGTVNLRDGSLFEARPRDHISKLTAVAPSSTADCPLWLRFLGEATGGDAGMVRFLQQWCGYCLTGDIREHALVFVHGDGGNGKSVFMNTIVGIMADYATTAPMDTFTASIGDRHPTEIAMLRGARLVTASETDDGKAWAEGRIKSLTGGDAITARFMRGDFFTYRPAFKLMIAGNHQPQLRNVDDAARRRFNIVPFTRKPAAPDQELEAKLKGEWTAILRWMIDGYLDWQTNGLVRPDSVVDATAGYFADQDLFAQWLADECDCDPGNHYKWEPTKRLFDSWAAYAKAAGELPGSIRTFKPTMLRHGLTERRTAGARGIEGIRLKPNLRPE